MLAINLVKYAKSLSLPKSAPALDPTVSILSPTLDLILMNLDRFPALKFDGIRRPAETDLKGTEPGPPTLQ
jgi:hypothetical protein